MKIEVAVNPRSPFQTLFVSEVVKGAIHDVVLFREGLGRYIAYLRKLPSERDLLPADSYNEMFAIMADKGYIGQFPGVRIITPTKHYESQQALPPSSTTSIPPFLSSPPDSTTESRQSHFTQSITTTTTSSCPRERTNKRVIMVGNNSNFIILDIGIANGNRGILHFCYSCTALFRSGESPLPPVQ